MKQIPETDDALVLRSDFSNQAIWDAICKATREPVGIFRFRANVEFLSDPELTGLTKDQLLASLPRNYPHTFIIVVDEIAITHPEHAVLIVDLYERSGHEFRAIPSQVQGIENNLSIANMDFDEFADSVDDDGIFRGFQES